MPADVDDGDFVSHFLYFFLIPRSFVCVSECLVIFRMNVDLRVFTVLRIFSGGSFSLIWVWEIGDESGIRMQKKTFFNV